MSAPDRESPKAPEGATQTCGAGFEQKYGGWNCAADLTVVRLRRPTAESVERLLFSQGLPRRCSQPNCKQAPMWVHVAIVNAEFVPASQGVIELQLSCCEHTSAVSNRCERVALLAELKSWRFV